MQKLVNFVVLALCMPIFVMGGRELGKNLGLIAVPVPVVGTGSMYPSLYWSQDEGGPDQPELAVIDERRTTPHMYRFTRGYPVMGRVYLAKTLSYGDLVAFQNERTAAILAQEGKDQRSGFIKRVVGLPGDKLELRDGFVYRNGAVLEEPYIYRPRSTYGDTNLAECQVITVPENQYLVLGDNRKASSDSRGPLGLISLADISYYLPYGEQSYYQSLWRDPAKDAELAGTPTLDVAEFYALLNDERRKRGVPALTAKPALERSASYAAAGSTMQASMSRAGYRNILTSEFSISGRFSAQELLQNLLSFKKTADQVLDRELDDIGVADLNLEIDGCPGEKIVGHLGGYLPAEYDAETIDSWRALVANLEEVIPSWEQAQEYPDLNQDKVRELLVIYRRRLALAQEVVAKMEKREWLDDSLQKRIESDSIDAKRASELAQELNQ